MLEAALRSRRLAQARRLRDTPPEQTLEMGFSLVRFKRWITFEPPEEAIAFHAWLGTARAVEQARASLARCWHRLDRHRLAGIADDMGVAGVIEALSAEVEAELDRLDRGPA